MAEYKRLIVVKLGAVMSHSQTLDLPEKNAMKKHASLFWHTFKWLRMMANATNITTQIKNLKKAFNPSITTVTITVYLKENGNKKKNRMMAKRHLVFL